MATQEGLYHGNLESGVSQVDILMQDYVFRAGLHDREHEKLLSYKYPQYYVTAFLDRLDASEGIARDVWSWPIMDRTRENVGVSGATITFGTDVTATFNTDKVDTKGYCIVGDVLRSESGVNFRVDAVGTAGGFQTITVSKLDGSAIASGDVANGEKLGHAFTSFGEASSAPEGRNYLPTEEYNYLHILRRSIGISGTEFTNRTILGDGKSWYFQIEDIEMKEFALDREVLVMFGNRTKNGTRKTTRGVWDYVEAEGVIEEVAGTVTETDMQNMIKELLRQGGPKEYTVLGGADFISGAQTALKDYALNGNMSYGSFGSNMAGLDFQSYKFLGITLHLTYYSLFEDTAILPFRGTSTAAKQNFSNVGLVMPIGKDDRGKPYVSLKHKELNGTSRKFVHGHKNGMAKGGEVSTGDDKFDVFYLSEIGAEVRKPNCFGIFKPTS